MPWLTYAIRAARHHDARIRTTNVLEGLFQEGGEEEEDESGGSVPERDEAGTLAKEIMLRSSEEWALKRYLSMEALEAVGKI